MNAKRSANKSMVLRQVTAIRSLQSPYLVLGDANTNDALMRNARALIRSTNTEDALRAVRSEAEGAQRAQTLKNAGGA